MLDPRILWVSAGGAYAVVRLRDIPAGVMRSARHDHQRSDSIDNASGEVYLDVKHDPVRVAGYMSDVAKVAVCDLPWTRGDPHARREITKRFISHYPHSCPWCGGRAYVGGGPKDIDCERKCR